MKRLFFSTFQGTAATRSGHVYEDAVLNVYEKDNSGSKVIRDAGLLINESEPWLGYSADGLLKKDREVILLEVKTILPKKKKPINTMAEFLNSQACLQRTENGHELREKHRFYGQIQLGLYLYRLRKATLLLFCKELNTIQPIDVMYDANFRDVYLNTLRNVYLTRVLPFLFQNRDELSLTVLKKKEELERS